ncbi:MAG: hypothetical protein ACYSUY_12885 [Planctomycetota bacterium]|jgi:hypothetical protein
MGKKITISSLAVVISAVAIASGFRSSKPRQMLLRDGFVLTGVDGRLVTHDSNEAKRNSASERWFFEFDSNVSDGRGLIKAGARLELLPSSVLERMIADANNGSVTSYRLGGNLTQYRDKNFIFPTYFLPLAKTKQQPSSTSQKSPQQENRPKINEPNDVLTIPKELIDKLPDRKKRIDHKTREKNGTELTDKRKPGQKQDSILADRCGFIRESGRRTQDTWRKVSFVLDAIGRTEAKTSLRLLPCQALELAQRKQSAAPEALRFKVAGIVTKYKGKDYLLLQRATRVYSHGNFPG